MPYADVNGERLYYELDGEGPPLVLIRGLSRSLRYWGPLRDMLAERFSLLLFDHRGIGRSEIQGRGFLLPDLARDLAELMRETGFERANVFGLSLGGMVAQHLALDHPERVDQLVLGATWCGGPGSRFPTIPTLAKLAVASRLPGKTGNKIMARQLLSHDCVKERPDVWKPWAEMLQQEPLDGGVVFRQALSGALHSVQTRLPKIDAKTLVVTGDADRLIHHENSRLLADTIPNARLEVLPGVGHELSAEVPHALADLLSDFCKA